MKWEKVLSSLHRLFDDAIDDDVVDYHTDHWSDIDWFRSTTERSNTRLGSFIVRSNAKKKICTKLPSHNNNAAVRFALSFDNIAQPINGQSRSSTASSYSNRRRIGWLQAQCYLYLTLFACTFLSSFFFFWKINNLIVWENASLLIYFGDK